MYFELFCVKISEENSAIHSSFGQNEAEVHPLSAEKVKAAAKAGLAAAAMKAKLFADHEEREIQRLSANIINHQVFFLSFSRASAFSAIYSWQYAEQLLANES